MRHCVHKPEFVGTGGEIHGVYFGYDHCAEHEFGISHIRRAFGLPQNGEEPDKLGMARVVPTKIPDDLFWYKWEDGSEGFLFISRRWFRDEAEMHKRLEHLREQELYFRTDHQPILTKAGVPRTRNPRFTEVPVGMAAAWDEHEFAIRAHKPEDIAGLKMVFEALRNKQTTLHMGGPDAGNPFGGSSICFLLIDAIPEDAKKARYEADKDFFEIKAWVKSTGIEKTLCEAGKEYFALSPQRFPDGMKDKNGKYKVRPGEIGFWLNPYEQKKNNFGWYSLEDLQQWAKGEGPIPMRRT